MGYERGAWAGTVTMALVGIYLSYKPIQHDLGRGLVAALAGLVIVAAILMFPWRRQTDGSPQRLVSGFRAVVGGSKNNVQIARDHANQTMHVNRGDETLKRHE